MKGMLLRWLINSLVILVVAHVIKGIDISSPWVVVVAAIVLGIINAVLRPLLILVTLPLNIMTLGIFTLFINAFLFYMMSKIVKGVSVAGFWPAFFGALLFSAISFFLNILINSDGKMKASITSRF